MTMLSLRRTALRLLSSSSPSLSISILSSSNKARSITRLTSSPAACLAVKVQRTPFLLPQQCRHYADEPATQNEPEADGATEAQHGDESIDASADADAKANIMSAEGGLESEDASKIESATETASEQASATADSLKSAAQTTGDAVTGAADGLLKSAGSFVPPFEYPPPPEQKSHTVYVGNLFFDVQSEDLKKEFERAGPVNNARVVKDHRGLSKGFGYVDFKNPEGAQKAIDLYNMQNFEGRRLSVQHSLIGTKKPSAPIDRSTDRPVSDPTKTLFIGNMSFDMSDRDLNNLFREIKNVIDVRVAIDRRTGQPRGFAHADFTDVPSAERAFSELAGKTVCGRQLRVDFSTSTGRASMTHEPSKAASSSA